MNIKIRLVIMNFLQFAVWGAYLTSMGSYLVNVGLASHIGIFYAMQGIVSLFMPAILGIIADRWIPAQKLLGLSHFLAALFMALTGYYGMTSGQDVDFGPLFTFYALSVAFYMPTLALSNSVAYTALDKAGLDTIRHFPPIRIFGTIGFICSMWAVDILGLQNNYGQFFACAAIGLVFAFYALTLPACPTSKGGQSKSLVEALGLRAFTLFRQKKMAFLQAQHAYGVGGFFFGQLGPCLYVGCIEYVHQSWVFESFILFIRSRRAAAFSYSSCSMALSSSFCISSRVCSSRFSGASPSSMRMHSASRMSS